MVDDEAAITPPCTVAGIVVFVAFLAAAMKAVIVFAPVVLFPLATESIPTREVRGILTQR